MEVYLEHINLLLDVIAWLASRFGRSDLLGEAPAAC